MDMHDFYFEKIWNKYMQQDLSEVQKFWDLRAVEFNAMMHNKEHSQGTNLLDFLLVKGFMHNDFDILDIGCGTGKHSLEFAKTAHHVTGLDISPEMIRYAKDNVQQAGLNNVSFTVIPWQDIDVAAMNWQKRFDLVFAAMSPAINSKDALLKMNMVSKKYCFMSGFVYRYDKVRDQLLEQIIGQKSTGNFDSNVYCAFNILWNMGIFPEITYNNVGWTKELSCDHALKMYSMWLRNIVKADDLLEKKIKNFVKENSLNGVIEETVEAKIAWMLWQV